MALLPCTWGYDRIQGHVLDLMTFVLYKPGLNALKAECLNKIIFKF